MERKSLIVRLPLAVHEKVARLAQEQGVSLNTQIVTMLAGDTSIPKTAEFWQELLGDKVAALEAHHAAMEARIAALEANPGAAFDADERYPGLPERQYLGTMCTRGHDWRGTGKSRRKKHSNSCVDCEKELRQARQTEAKSG